MANKAEGVVPSDNSVKIFYRMLNKAHNDTYSNLTEENLASNFRRKKALENISKTLSEADEDIKAWIKVEMPAFYEQGMFEASKGVFNKGGNFNINLEGAHFHREAIEALSRETYSDIATGLEGVQKTATRLVNTATREKIFQEIAVGQITGETAREVSKQIQARLREQGLTALRDRGGKTWDLRRYGNMLARTKLTQAHNSGVANRMANGGYDLVKITVHTGSCPLCNPWQGQVLSVSGASTRHTSLDSARSQGLFHPNCRHAMTPYHAEFLEDTQVWDTEKQTYVPFKQLNKLEKAKSLNTFDRMVFHGEGSEFQKKMREAGKTAGTKGLFGKGYYVSTDPDVAKKMGKVTAMQMRLPQSQILQINNQAQFEDIYKKALKKYPNTAEDVILQKYAKSQGFKAISGARTFDPFAGILVIDEKVLNKHFLVKEAWNSTVGMQKQYASLGIAFDGSEVLPKKMTTHIIDDFARKISSFYSGYDDKIIDKFHKQLDSKDYRSLNTLQDDLLNLARKNNVPLNP